MQKRIAQTFAVISLAASLLLAEPAIAGNPKVCKTPDGFIFTGIGNGKGIGGTGITAHNGKGIGGTGITGDIGVYGRITGFGSICVNGMEIEYQNDTPVSDAGRTSSTKDLAVGQVVFVHAYPDKEDFQAKKITIDKILSGPVSSIDAKSGKIIVLNQTVLAGQRHQQVLEKLKTGDHVAISGLRRPDGVIVAGSIEKISAHHTMIKNNASFTLEPGMRNFSVQGYIASRDSNRMTLSGGPTLTVPANLNASFAISDRVIVLGTVDQSGVLHAENIIPEHADFAPITADPVPLPPKKKPE